MVDVNEYLNVKSKSNWADEIAVAWDSAKTQLEVSKTWILKFDH